MAAAATVAIEQVLHGYKDGHRVLASSMSLSQDGARQMLVLSDLAGPGFTDDLDGYLSGYPIVDDSRYALSRTWYAPEMPRPGCVYTHTLLIDFADLAALPDVRVLLPRLRRPTGPASFSTYEKSFEIELSEEGPPREPFDEADATALLAALYGAPERPVLCRADGSARYEALLMALLDQQWPRLRRSFSFSTGATAARFVGARPFDLMCVPAQASRQAGRELPDAVWAQATTLEPKWRSTLLGDLRRRDPELRRFLWTYGADVQRPRSSMVPLVEAYLAQNRAADHPFADDAQRIAQAFPAVREALRLKRDLFQSSGTPMPQRLLNLAISPVGLAFTALGSQLQEAVHRLFAEQREAGLELLAALLRGEPNEVGEALRVTALGLLQKDDILLMKKTDPALLPCLALHVPSLFVERAVFQGSDDYQRELVVALSQSQQLLQESDLVRLLGLLSSPSPSVAGALVRGFGSRAVDALLTWVAQEPRSAGELRLWKGTLQAEPLLVLERLERAPPVPPPWTPWLIIALDPLSDAVQSRPLQWALEALGRIDLHAPGAVGKAAAIVLFAAALRHQDHCISAQLASGGFATVHDAVDRYSLPDEVDVAWRRLQHLLPSLGPWRDWDRCERLRRAFVKPFLSGAFDVRWFLPGLQDPWLLRKVIGSCLKLDGGSKFLRALERQIGREDWAVSADQRSVLHKELVGI